MKTTTMDTCKTCKHWDNAKTTEMGCGWCGDCTLSGGEMKPTRAWGQDPAYAWMPVGKPLGAEIVTGEDFGCIHHERKDGGPASDCAEGEFIGVLTFGIGVKYVRVSTSNDGENWIEHDQQEVNGEYQLRLYRRNK